jgi:hypothetical protein
MQGMIRNPVNVRLSMSIIKHHIKNVYGEGRKGSTLS